MKHIETLSAEIGNGTSKWIFLTGENERGKWDVLHSLKEVCKFFVFQARPLFLLQKPNNDSEKLFILIDEIEKGLSYNQQKALMQDLMSAYPKARFIVSTNSYVPILEAPLSSKVFRLERSKEGMIASEIKGVIGKSRDYVLSNVFDSPNEYGGEIQDDLDLFYELRDKILNEKKVGLRLFMKLALRIAQYDELLQSKVQFEIRQLQEVTGKKIFTL